MIELTKLQ